MPVLVYGMVGDCVVRLCLQDFEKKQPPPIHAEAAFLRILLGCGSRVDIFLDRSPAYLEQVSVDHHTESRADG